MQKNLNEICLVLNSTKRNATKKNCSLGKTRGRHFISTHHRHLFRFFSITAIIFHWQEGVKPCVCPCVRACVCVCTRRPNNYSFWETQKRRKKDLYFFSVCSKLRQKKILIGDCCFPFCHSTAVAGNYFSRVKKKEKYTLCFMVRITRRNGNNGEKKKRVVFPELTFHRFNYSILYRVQPSVWSVLLFWCS